MTVLNECGDEQKEEDEGEAAATPTANVLAAGTVTLPGQLEQEHDDSGGGRRGSGGPEDPLEQEIKEAFRLIDTNGDGGIDTAELQVAIRALGTPIIDAEAEKMVQDIDPDCDGYIGEKDFVAVMEEKIRIRDWPRSEAEIRKAFQLLDTAGKVQEQSASGLLTIDKLKCVAHDLDGDKEGRDKVTDEELEAMIKEASTDGGDEIDEEEFVRAMKTSLY